MCDEPIVLIHWGNPNCEYDEIEEIEELLRICLFDGVEEAQKTKSPRIASVKITESDSSKMVDELKEVLNGRTNVQTIYVSCHGNSNALFFKDGGSSINYKCFGSVLGEALDSDNCAHLVMGSCEAMSAKSSLKSALPNQIYAVSGFSACPQATDVAALLASIVIDDVCLFQKLSVANHVICGSGASQEKVIAVKDTWKQIMDGHNENPTQEVLCDSGCSIITEQREENGSNWERKEYPLR